MRMLLQQTWRYLPAQIVAPGLQLAALLLWAHLLPLEEVGRLTLIIAAQEVLFAGLFMGWTHFMLRYRIRYDARRFRHTEILVVAVAVFLQCAFLLAGLLIATAVSPSFWLCSMAFAAMRSLSTVMAERARAVGDVVSYTALQAWFPALGLLLALAFIMAGHDNAQAVLLALMLAYAAAIAFAGRGGWRDFRLRADRAILRAAFVFGAPLAIASLLAAASVNAPRFLVEHTFGLAGVGLFGIVYGLGMRAAGVAVMLVTAAAYPLAVRTMENEGTVPAHRQLSANMVLVALVLFPAGFGLIGIAGSLVKTLLPAALHEPATALLPIAVLCGVVRYFRTHTSDQLFLLHGRSGYSAVIGIAECVSVVSLTALGLSFGLKGALVGTLAAFCICGALSMALAFKLGFRFPAFALARIAAAAALMMVALQAMPETQTVWMLPLFVFAGAAIYAVSLIALFPRVCAAWLPRAVGA